MTRRVLFSALSICWLVLPGVVSASGSQPSSPQQPRSQAQAPQGNDVWSLLERGENENARHFFVSEVEANATDAQGRTPLHIVAEKQDPQMAAFFIALGANPNAVDGQNRTPLDISAGLLDRATAKALTDAGADIHHSPDGINTPARTAVLDAGAFLDAILNQQALDSSDADGRTLLHLAAVAGSASSTAKILAAGRNDFNRRDGHGRTALDIALERTDRRNCAQTAELLILAGAVSDSETHPIYAYFAPAVRSSNYNIRSADGMAPLHFLAREGYTGYIDFVLEKGADPNSKNAAGSTPLHEAARSGNVRVMQALLDSGADVKSQDAKGNSVLHIAVPPDTHQEAAELFLQRGADPSVRDLHGDSPLHIAIILNRPRQLIRTLLAAGSDVTIRNIEGKTPLYLAIQEGRDAVIPGLLEYGSDIFAVDNEGISSFERALRAGYPILDEMIRPDTIFESDSMGNTMLHVAVRSRADTDVINHILDLGDGIASGRNIINARNRDGDTALHLAVLLNEQAAGELLLNRGADIFAPNSSGESPLFIAFPKPRQSPNELRRWMLNPQTLGARDGLGNTALHYMAQWQFDLWIPQVVRMGANADALNATRETPLFSAVKNNSPSTITVLVANGATRDARDILGNTALHAAVRWDAPRAAEALLVLGLDINAQALNGKTPLHDSIRFEMPDLETILLSHGAALELRDADGNTPLMEAVLAGSAGSMRRLAEKGAITNTRNLRGDTPLHIAALAGNSDVSLLLLSWGVSIHAKNSRGDTPLHNALRTSPSATRTLLAGNRILLSDDEGNSALHIAVQKNSPYAILRMMLDMGARTDALDSRGRTPLRLAVDEKNWEAAKTLADAGSDVFVGALDGISPAELALNDNRAVQALFTGRAIGTRDSSGNTILHYAARNGNVATILQLMELGADKNIENFASERPSKIAQLWGHSDAAALLN